MPDFPFTNQQTVHITHPFGTDHIPVYVEAEGTQRDVEVAYGDGYLEVLFGRVMAYGLVGYSAGVGGGTVLVNDSGSAGRVEHGRQGSSASSNLVSLTGTTAGRPSTGSSGAPASGSFTIN